MQRDKLLAWLPCQNPKDEGHLQEHVPNGKIYIGQDVTDSINYFGSASGKHIAIDFTREERQTIAIQREILWESETATQTEMNQKEFELIRLHRSNELAIGYNRRPRFKATS